MQSGNLSHLIKLQTGKLRHLIELQSNSAAVNDYGEDVDSWATYATVWAEVVGVSGNERLRAQQVVAEATTLVRTWYRSDVTAEHRVLHESRVLEIVDVQDPDGMRRELLLSCKEAKQ